MTVARYVLEIVQKTPTNSAHLFLSENKRIQNHDESGMDLVFHPKSVYRHSVREGFEIFEKSLRFRRVVNSFVKSTVIAHILVE